MDFGDAESKLDELYMDARRPRESRMSMWRGKMANIPLSQIIKIKLAEHPMQHRMGSMSACINRGKQKLKKSKH